MIDKLRKIKRRFVKFKADQKFYRALHILEGKKCQFAVSSKDRPEKLVVSLTSYGRRLQTVYISIESMLCQTYRPDKIILYLGDDIQEKDIPEKLSDLTQYGVEIKFEPGNLRSHKKYFYAMQDYPDALIVTIDDDLLYPEYMLEELVQEHGKYPNAVIAARIHEIRFDEKGTILPYMKWGYEYDGSKQGPALRYLATGGGGTLYPPGAVGTEFFDESLIKDLSYTTDDLWLKIGEIRSGTPVKMADARIWKNTCEFPTAIEDALSNGNVYGGINDVNMKKIMEYFNITKNDFFEKRI